MSNQPSHAVCAELAPADARARTVERHLLLIAAGGAVVAERLAAVRGGHREDEHGRHATTRPTAIRLVHVVVALVFGAPFALALVAAGFAGYLADPAAIGWLLPLGIAGTLLVGLYLLGARSGR